MKTFLHVGCGRITQQQLIPFFAAPGWRELRLDIDPDVAPDIVGSMTDMAMVASGSMDALYSSHNLEHLYPHEVDVALKEFGRVLKPEGFAVITCPDLQSICRRVADGKLLDPAYESAAGPIAAIDMLYGLRPELARGNHHMAHRCGFTLDVLHLCLGQAGFGCFAGFADAENFALWTVARKDKLGDAEMIAFAQSIFGYRPEPQ